MCRFLSLNLFYFPIFIEQILRYLNQTLIRYEIQINNLVVLSSSSPLLLHYLSGLSEHHVKCVSSVINLTSAFYSLQNVMSFIHISLLL